MQLSPASIFLESFMPNYAGMGKNIQETPPASGERIPDENQPQTRQEFLSANPSPASDADFINEKQFLAKVPISRRTLWNWRKKGLIPSVKLPGGKRVLFHWPSVEAALLRRQKELQN